MGNEPSSFLPKLSSSELDPPGHAGGKIFEAHWGGKCARRNRIIEPWFFAGIRKKVLKIASDLRGQDS